jgi:hypothetical protein
MGEDSRKNIKIEASTWEQLRDEKRPAETWDEFLLGLVEKAPRKADTVRIEDAQVRVIARETADEMEDRLR